MSKLFTALRGADLLKCLHKRFPCYSTCLISLQLPHGVIAWGIAWVVASLAHGLGGQNRAYWEQRQRAPGCQRLKTVGGNPTAHCPHNGNVPIRKANIDRPGHQEGLEGTYGFGIGEVVPTTRKNWNQSRVVSQVANDCAAELESPRVSQTYFSHHLPICSL